MNQSRRRGVVLLIISVVLACIAGFLLISVISSEEQSKRELETQFGERVWVIVVQKDIPARTPLTLNALLDGRLKLELRPRVYTPPAAFAVDAPDETQATYSAISQFRDRIKGFTLIPLKRGDILSPSIFETAVVVPENMRAVSLAVDNVSSVSGYVHPGDFVDVIASYEQTQPDQKKIQKTIVLFQNKQVLATSWFSNVGPSSGITATTGLTMTVLTKTGGGLAPSSSVSGSQQRDTVVTLALSLDEAERLSYMQDFGKEIHLVLRRLDDTSAPQLPSITQDNFGK